MQRKRSIPRTCQQCGTDFLATTQAVNRGGARFCSNACKHAAARKPMVDRICDQCGKSFQVHPFVVRKGEGHFCSRRCSTKSKTGPLAAQWKGGISERPGGHEEWSRAVKERDGHTCQRCGKVGGYLHAHHIQAWETHPELRHELSNGMTLCVPCHRAIHSGQSPTLPT